MIVVAIAAAVGVVALSVSLVGDTETEEPLAAPTSPTATATATPSPTPTPTPPPPVEAERELETVVTSHGPIIFPRGDDRHPAAEPDVEAVEAFAARVGDWLDAHLTDLQEGGSGQLDRYAAGLLDAADGEVLAGLTTELATAERPVAEARYRMVVAADGAPQWLHVRLDVTRADDAERSAELVVGHVDAEPRLLAASPVHPDAPPFEAPPHPDEGVHR